LKLKRQKRKGKQRWLQTSWSVTRLTCMKNKKQKMRRGRKKNEGLFKPKKKRSERRNNGLKSEMKNKRR